MDWLDEILDKFKAKINNLSLRNALCVYILVCLLFVFVLTAITQTTCNQWDSYIWGLYNHANSENVVEIVNYYDYSKLTKLDRLLVELIDFTQTWSTIFYAIIGIIGVSYLFYHEKIKIPLELLKEATSKVGKNDLDIELTYDNKDEFGDLCRSFDMMRAQLIDNNQKMWDIMEEQKRLNAAFAHDLRTPLTVLRGYTDLLCEYTPEHKISEDKLLSTLTLMSEQIRRLESYTNTMKELNSLDDLPVKRKPTEVMVLENRMRESIEVLDGKNEVHIKLFNSIFESNSKLMLDETILMEVFENLLSNALRYAVNEIEVILSLSEEGNRLLLSVADDGKGFTKTDLIMATKPYYSDRQGIKTNHFGIGLSICKTLCEKHQGGILLENRMKTGAVVTASFAIAQ